MCVHVLFVAYCVMLCGSFVVVFVCSFKVRVVFDLLCDVLWLAFVWAFVVDCVCLICLRVSFVISCVGLSGGCVLCVFV